MAGAFHANPATDELWRHRAACYRSGPVLGAFDPELIGVARSVGTALTVPGGGQVTADMVMDVAVRADRTRRGVMTDLMKAQLADMTRRGVTAAVLKASEGGIYRRFGYGVSTRTRTYRVDRRRGRLHDEVPGDGIELLGFTDASRAVPAIYAQIARSRPGMITRTPQWWAMAAASASGAPAAAAGPIMTAVHCGPDGPDGYAVYSVTRAPGVSTVLRIADMHTSGPAAFGALWRHLLSLDLVDEIEAPDRPADEPVELLFTDPRACRTTAVTDEQWLRLVDVPAALAARTYLGDAVVIEVTDPLLGHNRGTYRIAAEGIRRTGEPAQLRLGVAALADVYLGTWRPSALAQAGLVDVRDRCALPAADRLFASPIAPWCGNDPSGGVMRELARIRDFRLLFAGLLATMVGDLLLTLMLAVWVQKLTGSDSAAGITFGCGVIAYAVSPLIAWPADWFRRRPLVITANVGTAAILIPLLTVHHSGRIWVIYAVAAAYGAISVIAAAASQGLIGLIVPAASMPDAYGALQTARQSSRVFVPVIGVALYIRVGPAVVVVVTVVALLASAAVIAAIRVPEPRPEPGRTTLDSRDDRRRPAARHRPRPVPDHRGQRQRDAGRGRIRCPRVRGGHRGPGQARQLSQRAHLRAGGNGHRRRDAVRADSEAARRDRGHEHRLRARRAGIFLAVFPSLATVVAAYALAGFAVPLGGVSAYNALQHRTPGRLLARTMVAFTSAVGLPQAIAIPAAAILLATVGFRTLILICVAIAMFASAYVWRGRALTQPSRGATLAARPWSRRRVRGVHRASQAVLERRRQSRQLDIGGVIVGSGAVLVNAGNIRTFDDRVEAIAHAAMRAGTPIWLGVEAGSLDKRLLARCGRATAEGLVESALCECSLFGEHGFTDIKISVQHHDPVVMTNADRQLAARCDYPPYLGVTGAGLRVPLPASPVEEIKVGIATLESLGLRESGLEIAPCPSCGRAKVAVYTLADQLTAALEGFTAPLLLSDLARLAASPPREGSRCRHRTIRSSHMLRCAVAGA